MGLLDVFNTDEGRFNLGLLAAAAPRADNAGFGQRLNEAMSGLDARKSEKLKSDLLAAQMQHYNAQSKHLENADALALQKQTQIEGALKDVFGGTSPGAYTMPQGGGPVMPPQQGGLGNTSIDQVARLHAMGGPNLMDAFKWINEPQKFESGSTYTSRKDGTERQMPKLGEGMVGDSKGVSMAPGYLDSFGAVKNEEERAKANFQLLPRDMVDTGSGRPIGGTVGQYVNSQKPQPTGIAERATRQPYACNATSNYGGLGKERRATAYGGDVRRKAWAGV